MWEVNSIAIPWLRSALMFNPVTFVANGYRNAFINGTWFFDQPKRLRIFCGCAYCYVYYGDMVV